MQSLLNKKGQLKIQQMAMMLLAITLFFLLVFMFYISIRTSSLRQEAVQLNREQAAGLATKIVGSPEFNFAGTARGVDFDKVMALKNRREYDNFWEVNGIVVEKLYPSVQKSECTSTNYPNCTTITLFTDGRGEFVHSYISLCRKTSLGDSRIYDNCELAIIKLGVKKIDE